MDFRFTAEEKLRQEVRRFMEAEITDELIRDSRLANRRSAVSRSFLRKLGEKGWIAAAWPREYGGLECTHIEKQIIRDEIAYFIGTLLLLNADIVAPIFIQYGSEEQKEKFLRPLGRGEITFTIGYSEPGSGSDLASLKMEAKADGDDYVINGQKMFSSGADQDDYHFLLARTNPDVPRHKGLSLFIVDLKSPGITIRPLQGMAARTTEVFYDSVRVPRANMLGEKDKAWFYIIAALAWERSWIIGESIQSFDELLAFIKEKKDCAANPLIRQRLAALAIELEVTRLLSYRVVWMQTNGIAPYAEAAIAKVFGSEVDRHLAQETVNILGPYSLLNEQSKWVPLKGDMEFLVRDSVRRTITRGTSEVLRTLVAQRGLGLPVG